MQRLAREICPRSIAALAPAAVDRVARDGQADMRKMHADLVRAAGLKLNAQQRVSAEPFLHAVMGDGPAPVTPYGHAGAGRAMPADRRLDPSARGRRADAHGQIFAP